MCVGGGHRCSPNTGSPCSLALAPIGWPLHGGGLGASVCLHGQLHHRSVCVYVHVSVCLSVCLVCIGSHCTWTMPAHCLCLQLAIWLGHSHWALRAPLSSPPLSNIVCHCIRPVPARLPLTMSTVSGSRDQAAMATGFRPFGDVGKHRASLCCLKFGVSSYNC